MTAATLDEYYEMPGEPERGTVTLQAFVNESVAGGTQA
jgi:hypothetical protein